MDRAVQLFECCLSLSLRLNPDPALDLLQPGLEQQNSIPCLALPDSDLWFVSRK